MLIKVNSFEIELCSLSSLYIHIPYIGEAFLGNGMTSFESWRSLKK
jgi:hypothetical protein